MGSDPRQRAGHRRMSAFKISFSDELRGSGTDAESRHRLRNPVIGHARFLHEGPR